MPTTSDLALGRGRLWAAVRAARDEELLPIDPTTNRPGRAIGIPDGVNRFALDGRFAWVVDNDSVTDTAVRRVDLVTGAIGRRMPIGTTAEGVAVGGGAVWLSSFADATVTRIPLRQARG